MFGLIAFLLGTLGGLGWGIYSGAVVHINDANWLERMKAIAVGGVIWLFLGMLAGGAIFALCAKLEEKLTGESEGK